MIKQAALWQTASSIVNLVLGMLQIAILARLLDVADFGVMAILMVVISITQVFSDLGMANYIVHKQKSTPELNSTIFWMCIASGIVLFTVLAICSPIISSLYDRPQIQHLLPLAALAFLPISAVSQIQAQYTRAMRLKDLAKIEIVARVFATVTAITSALYGYGIESIIFGNLAFSGVKCLLVWFFANAEWRPGFIFSLSEAKLAWRYGVYQIGSQLINQLRVNLDTMFLGFYLGDTSLGYYSLAKQLISKPTTLILPIARKLALPLIARVQSETERLTALVGKAHIIVALLLMWPYSLFIVLAQEVTYIVYGSGYDEVATLIIPLSIFWLLRSVGGALAGPLVQALGKTKIDFYWNLFVFGILVVVCYTFSPYGTLALARALVILQCIQLVAIYYVYFKSVINLKLSVYFKPIIVFMLVALLSSVSASLLIDSIPFINNQFIYVGLIVCISGGVNYILCWLFQSDMIDLPSPYLLICQLTKKLTLGK
jgi:O-antigen/teichoic acid export membrane protein